MLTGSGFTAAEYLRPAPRAQTTALVVRGERRWGFEVKYADAPRTTKSMRSALDDRIQVLALRSVGSVEGMS